jgi:hypothetical protein
MLINRDQFCQRVLKVLTAHPKGLTKTQLRAKAFNRIPVMVTDKWLDWMVRRGDMVRYVDISGSKGRPALIYHVNNRSKR